MEAGFKLKMLKNEETERIEAELSLYGAIGRMWDGIVASEVVEQLSDVQADLLTVYLNSPGGDPFDGFAIKNRIDKLISDGQLGEVHTVAEGLVASAATLPFLAGTKRSMRQGSRFMIHEAHGMAVGDAEQMRKYADELERTNLEAAELYAAKSNHTETQIAKMMAAETWMSPAESVQAGFATERSDAFAVAACVRKRDLERMHFMRAPEDLLVDPQPVEDPRVDELRKKCFDLTAAS